MRQPPFEIEGGEHDLTNQDETEEDDQALYDDSDLGEQGRCVT